MATYVLVHGAGHGGWCYQPVAKMLRAHGHRVYAPSLTGLAERSHLMGPHVDLQCHIQDIVGLLQFEDLRDAVLVGHGYGGMVVTGAADRLHRRVGHLVYLDAPVPDNGQSFAELAVGATAALRRYVVTIRGVEMCHPPAEDVLSVYGVSDPVIVRWMAPRLTPHPWKCFEQPIELNNEVRLAGIPQSHIVTAWASAYRDVADLEKRHDGRVWRLQSGHDMMLTEPVWLAEKLSATTEWLPRCHVP